MEEKRESKSKEKIKEVYYIKEIAIILVFGGHAATPSFLERPYNYEFLVQMIYSIHMPLFFMVSRFLSFIMVFSNSINGFYNKNFENN